MTLDRVLDALGRSPSAQDLASRLPGRGAALRLSGLPGSSGAALVAWLLREAPQRMVAVVAPTPSDAERWLADLALLTPAPAALYPQREALGEEEPHFEIAGERAEALEALLGGRLRVLVTTARATAERTLVPAALERLRVRLAAGVELPPAELAGRLEAMGYRRVPTVTEVAEFSVRGGILDVYGFGMADPARLEWWGDEISSLRGFDLTSQRSQAEIREVVVLPIGSGAAAGDGAAPGMQRRTVLDLLPPDALVVEEADGPDSDEVLRAWDEAAHHLDIARRLGEEVPKREDIFEDPALW